MNLIKNKKGFSLIEVVLIMFVISFAFVGVYNVFSKVSQHDKDNRYNLIAANLAQEGIEIIRNKRDNGFLAGDILVDALENKSNCAPYLDSNDDPQCDSTKLAKIGKDSEKLYQNCPSGGCGLLEETIFERTCDIEDGADDSEKIVTCRVEWESPTLKTNKKIEIKSILTDWQLN
jgi:type II secretory pathway pseudopilin PulG